MPFQAATATPRRAVTPAAFVRGVVAAYALYGRDPTEAWARGRSPPDLVRSRDGRVTAAQFEALAGHAMRELDDEALGWFSRRLPLGHLRHAVPRLDHRPQLSRSRSNAGAGIIAC